MDRSVYRVRGWPGRLAKVMRLDVDAARLLWWEHRVTRHVEAKGFPVPLMHGLIATDLGIAQVVDAVLDDDGALGPTLADLERGAQIGPYECDLMNQLATALLYGGLPFYELKPHNIVLGRRAGIGPTAFWLVDGFGERQVLPLRRLLPARRRAYALARLPKLANRIPALAWDAAAARFRLTDAPPDRRVAGDGAGR